jgi:hypothetical protein
MAENLKGVKVVVRRAGKKFVVAENIEALLWPQECAACGGKPGDFDNLLLKSKFRNLGQIQVLVKGIPYCAECFPKIHRGKTLDKIATVMTWVLGIPLGILLIALSARNSGSQFIWLGLVLLVGLAIAWGLTWLFIRLPARMLLKKSLAEPVDAWLIEEKKADSKAGVCVAIAIPNTAYAAKFAALNSAV